MPRVSSVAIVLSAAGILLLGLALPSCRGSRQGSDGEVPVGGVRLERAFPALTFLQPLGMFQPPGDGGRWFLLEREGRVLRFSDDQAAAAASVALDIRGQVSADGEGGLLGMAFAPAFAGSGEVILSYTAPGSPLVSVVSRWRVDAQGDIDAGSEEVVLSVPQPYTNHNGGAVAYGPDGLLYVGLGDGGGAGDPEGNGQDTTTLLGAILRIDPSAPEGGRAYGIPAGNVFAGSSTDAPEIFAWGFRNPWRFSFDRDGSRGLWAGDVGQNDWEEVDLVEGGLNYGWNVMEGEHCYPPGSECDPSPFAPPVVEYGHDRGHSVTGGYVYRGSALPALAGHYLFGDYETGRIWAFDTSERQPQARLLVDTSLAIASFAEDAEGELYVLDIAGGGVYRLVPEAP